MDPLEAYLLDFESRLPPDELARLPMIYMQRASPSASFENPAAVAILLQTLPGADVPADVVMHAILQQVEAVTRLHGIDHPDFRVGLIQYYAVNYAKLYLRSEELIDSFYSAVMQALCEVLKRFEPFC